MLPLLQRGLELNLPGTFLCQILVFSFRPIGLVFVGWTEMGQQQSKDELLYQQVSYGNTEGIKALCRDGAGLEVIVDSFLFLFC